jgi:hypothetical protein
MMLEIFIGNTNLAVMTGVKNGITGDIDDGATLTITLYESDGTTPVTGQTWPAPMFNETGGTYVATLEEGLVLSLNHIYVAIVDGVGSAGEIMHIEQKAKAKIRGSDC